MFSLLFVLVVLFGFGWILTGVMFRSSVLVGLGFILLLLGLGLYFHHYVR